MNSHHYVFGRLQYAALFALLFITSFHVSAQPQLTFDSVSVAFPQITLHFKVGCSIIPKKTNYTVKEDGKIVANFSLYHADTTRTRCCISVALVIDRSATMNGEGLIGAKTGAKAFVDRMDGSCDEATLVSFSNLITVDVSLTKDKILLVNGIDGLSAVGATAVWDAAIVGIQELVTNGTQPCRGVILLTDGEDNSSNHTVDDVIAFATANHIPIYTIGVGTGVNDADLSRIAASTGGKYTKVPDPSQLSSAFLGLFNIISQASVAGEITYTTDSKCLDGSTKTVDLTINAATGCPGTITKTKTYKMPLDSSTFQTAIFKIGTVTAVPGSIVELPLTLETDINDSLQNAQIFIEINQYCSQLLSIDTRGFLLDGVPIDLSPIPNGYGLYTMKVTGPLHGGILALLKFAIPPNLSDRECPVTLKAWIFSKGCLKPILVSGKIIISNPKIIIVSPNGGQSWCAGTTQQITWTSTNLHKVKILLSSDAGSTFPVLLADSVDASLGYWDWQIPSNIPSGTRYRIQILDEDGNGFAVKSLNNFMITSLPVILTQPSDKTVCVGDSAAFTVKFDSASSPGVQWQVRSAGDSVYRDIGGAIYATLILRNLDTAQNMSQYRAHLMTVCTNSYSDSALLTINPSLAILSQPQSQEICFGSTVIFSVSVAGTNILYQWRKDGIPINYATSSSLTIPSVAQNDLGNYDVTLSAACSAFPMTSSAAKLSPIQIPQITSQPKADTICIGTPVTFSVSANGKGLKYQWRKGGTPITGAISPVFTILSATNSDYGLYDVDITDTCGLIHVVSNPAQLIVNQTPVISTQPSNQSLCEGSTATFTVAASPVSSYQWLKNGIAAPGATSNQFVINNVLIADTGSYSVRLTNACGQTLSSSAYLSVLKTTSISLQPVSQTVKENTNVTFTVNAIGTNLAYQWRKNGVDIPGATNSSFTISSAKKSDEGNYTVLVSGQCGQPVLSGIAALSVTLVGIGETSTPSFYLGQNYPNPFTRTTTIGFRLNPGEGRGEVRFKVYDVFGREVLDFSNKIMDNSPLTIDYSQLPTQGIYFYRLTVGNESRTKMMTLIK